MFVETDNQDKWVSRKGFVAAMLSQTLGPHNIIMIPHQAVLNGAIGHIMLYAAIYIFIGIPVLYMEYVVGQFTGRDCLDVWKARSFVSHVAFIQIFWQIINLVVNHLYNAFTLHYFLISFENPIPYYICGRWSTPECNILHTNYTIHQDCLTSKGRMAYCDQLCTTFPEYQYWRYYILGLNKVEYHLAWRVNLASAIVCFVLFLSNFRRTQSVKPILKFSALFIISVSVLFLTGAMLQKGVVIKFYEAMDSSFAHFSKYIDFSASVVEVLFSLRVGSGISFNLASSNSFRSPCYSNTVIVVLISAAVAVIQTCTNALMLCPYSSKYKVHPLDIAKYQMFLTYEMIPRLLYDYESNSFWLILKYCLVTTSILYSNIVIVSSFIEVISQRNSRVAKYPGTITLSMVVIVYLGSILLLGNKSLNILMDLQRGINFLTIFVAMIECLIFLLCYGLGRFCEDVHFMSGVRPRAFIKVSWILSIFVLIYTFSTGLCNLYNTQNITWGTMFGWWLFIFIITLTVLVTILKILIAIYNKRLKQEISLDTSWAPKSEILKRSRAMFTTHAMTKEYIYRQYHLQAGILMRQRSCNVRA